MRGRRRRRDRARRADARPRRPRRPRRDPAPGDPLERPADRGGMRRDPRAGRARAPDRGHGQRRAAGLHGAQAPVDPATRARGLVPHRARPPPEGLRAAPAQRGPRGRPSRRRRDAPVRPRARATGRTRWSTALEIDPPGCPARSRDPRSRASVSAGSGQRRPASERARRSWPAAGTRRPRRSRRAPSTRASSRCRSAPPASCSRRPTAPSIEPDGRLHAFCHAVPARWHLMGVMLSAGGSLRWYRDALAPGVEFADLVAEASERAGRQRRPALPSLPDGRAHALPRPARAGRLRRAHRPPRAPPSHARGARRSGVRAAGLVRADAIGRRSPRTSEIRATGGGSASPLWRQILADVLETLGRDDVDRRRARRRARRCSPRSARAGSRRSRRRAGPGFGSTTRRSHRDRRRTGSRTSDTGSSIPPSRRRSTALGRHHTPAAKIASITRMLATASSGGIGVGSPSRTARAKRSAWIA